MRQVPFNSGICALALSFLAVGCGAEGSAAARYEDAQFNLRSARSAAESRTRDNRAEFRALAVEPGVLADPAKVQRLLLLGMLDPDPEIAKNTPRLIASMLQAAAAMGNQGVTQTQADQLSAALGTVPFGDTVTGTNERLANDRRIAQARGNATIGAARVQSAILRKSNIRANGRVNPGNSITDIPEITPDP